MALCRRLYTIADKNVLPARVEYPFNREGDREKQEITSGPASMTTHLDCDNSLSLSIRFVSHSKIQVPYAIAARTLLVVSPLAIPPADITSSASVEQ